jgi:hypothetical protein
MKLAAIGERNRISVLFIILANSLLESCAKIGGQALSRKKASMSAGLVFLVKNLLDSRPTNFDICFFVLSDS